MPLKLAPDCYKSLLPYVAPRLAAVEIEPAVAPEIRVVEVATGVCGAPGSAVAHGRSSHPGGPGA